MEKHKKNAYWTKEDIDFVGKIISRHGVMEGFVVAGKELGISSYAVKSAYYKYRHCSIPASNKHKCITKELEATLAKIMAEEVSKNPNNIHQALINVSNKTGIRYTTVESRWYGTTSDYKKAPTYRGNIGTVFSLIGNKGLINQKNTQKPNKDTSKILNIIRRIFRR